MPSESDDFFERAVEHSGCPQCEVFVISGVYVCEHGVTTPPEICIKVTTQIDLGLYNRLIYGDEGLNNV